MYSECIRQNRWWPDTQCHAQRIAHPWQTIIRSRQSLTQILIRLARVHGGNEHDFHVRVLQQSKAMPLLHEQRKLNNPPQRIAIIRQVELQLFSQTVVFARSILPIQSKNKGASDLANIGNRPLGHVLFKNGRSRFSKREYCTSQVRNQPIFGRRTPYEYQGNTVLVAEFFLPALAPYLAQG